MKSFRKELWFDIPSRVGFVNITSQVESALKESGKKEGFVLANARQVTASVFINDDESGCTMITRRGWMVWFRMSRWWSTDINEPAKRIQMRI
jgi:hypothetical protein